MKEERLQYLLFRWKNYYRHQYPVLERLHAIPNGMHAKSAMHAARQVSLGLKKGVYDIFLPKKKGKWCGLYIELKVGKNKPSDEQIAWGKMLEKEYVMKVHWTLEDTVEEICKYLDIEAPILDEYPVVKKEK